MADESSSLVGGGEREQPGLFTRIFRFVHRDIDGEIPEHMQATVRLSYYSWWLFTIGMTWNLVCFTVMTVQKGGCGLVWPITMACILWTALLPTVFGVHLLLHNGAKNGSSFSLCMHMCLNATYVATLVLFSVGLCNVGVAGILSLIKAFSQNVVTGMFFLVCLLVWAVVGLIQLWVLYHSFRAYKQGGSPQQHHSHEIGSQAFQYAYQNPQVLRDVSAALPEGTDAAAAARTVYQQPDEVGQAIYDHQQAVSAQYHAQPTDYPEPTYDPRSVFG